MIIHGDSKVALKFLEPESIDMVFSSPSPFMHNEIGIGGEPNRAEYLNSLLSLFHNQVWRVLKPAGSLYVQLADYHDDSGSMTLIPERFSIKMQDLGWLVRSKPIWVRTEKFVMMEDYQRYTRDWEPVLFFTKTWNHYFNNPRFKINSAVNYHQYHEPRGNNFESGFPERLIERCIHFSCPPGGTVLDPLCGSGITGIVAQRMKRKYVLIDINEEKVAAVKARLELAASEGY